MINSTLPTTDSGLSRTQLTIQLAFTFSMYFGVLIAYLLPLKWIVKRQGNGNVKQAQESHKEDARNEKVLSYCNCLAAGIFLAICFLGLIPIVDEEFLRFFAKAELDHVQFPVSQWSTLMGFFLLLFLEELITIYRSRKPSPPVLHLDETAYTELTNHLLESGDESPKVEKKSVREELTPNGSTELHHGHGHSHGLEGLEDQQKAGLAFFVLIFGTGIHSVFEGLALGLMKDMEKAVHLFFGIILHEVLVALALGINSARLKNTSRSTCIKFGLVFASTVPVGILLGLLLGQAPGLFGTLISAIFQALAAGTFLHVAFCELIPSELISHGAKGSAVDGDHHISKLSKISLMFAGFLAMAAVSLFTGSHHE